MNTQDLENYNLIKEGHAAFYPQKRGLIAVWGKEAVQFLNGLITNDVAKFENYHWMPAAFSNAQGRLLAIVRVVKIDEKFIFVTEAATHEKIFQNLFRFTFAGEFFVEDLSQTFESVSLFAFDKSKLDFKVPTEYESVAAKFDGERGFIIRAPRGNAIDVFIPNTSKNVYKKYLDDISAFEISDELYEVLRIEQGIPLYGVDMDETTIVPELGIDGLISYNKGCYIGQEIIARIHFRGHVAKQLRGLVLSEPSAVADGLTGAEIKTIDGKNAGRITSATFSPKFQKTIALGFVRYDFLADGTELKIGETTATVKNLPFTE